MCSAIKSAQPEPEEHLSQSKFRSTLETPPLLDSKEKTVVGSVPKLHAP